MKKNIYTLSIAVFTLACSGDQPATTPELIAAKNLKGLKIQRASKLKELKRKTLATKIENFIVTYLLHNI